MLRRLLMLIALVFAVQSFHPELAEAGHRQSSKTKRSSHHAAVKQESTHRESKKTVSVTKYKKKNGTEVQAHKRKPPR